LKRLLVTSFLVALLAPASASDPILTVDSGGHQPVIRDLKLSADGRYLVSGSRDKIIRVWDARTKKEVRKILGQVGEGPDGMVYAIALSLDDRWRHRWLITQQFQ
jgi:WD40 repeat protein